MPHQLSSDAPRYGWSPAPWIDTARACVLSLLTGTVCVALAQTSTLPDAAVLIGTSTHPTTHHIAQSQRLAQWLRTNAAATQSIYPLATAWSTPEEAQRQASAQSALWNQLQQTLHSPANQPLLQWMQKQPATGRMRLPAVNVQWLEANPQRDPLLRAGDVLITHPQIGQVLVLSGSGESCRMQHQTNLYAADYLQGCSAAARAFTTPAGSQPLWLIQPDGRVQRTSVASWNPMVQTQPAPQALLWTGWPHDSFRPGTREATREQLNEATAQWLATRTDSLASWLQHEAAAHASVSTPAPILASDNADAHVPTDWSGLHGPRFNPEPSASNWGVVGLMQTPTARMRSAGSFGLNYQRTWPYSWLNVMLQPLDWLEAGFRYTDIANRAYGPESLSGSQSYKDKSFEIKARLWRESSYVPELALGVRDLGGTGLFGGEYLVASKRWGRLDYSLGLGWGYVGGRQNLANPLGAISSRVDQRQNDVGSGGTVSTQSFFRGRTALFGGVEYQSPWGPVLKAEYDGNHYQSEPRNNNQPQKTPINLGLVYRVAPGLDLNLGRERGTTWTLGLTLYTDLSRLNMPKHTDKPTPAVAAQRPSTSGAPAAWAQTRNDLQNLTQWQVDSIQRQGEQLVVDLSQSNTPYHLSRIDKAMAVLHRDAPADIEQIELRHRALGDVLAVDRIDRQNWVQPFVQPARSSEPSTAIRHSYPQAHSLPATLDSTQAVQGSTVLLASTPERYSVSPGIHLNHTLGGPDGFVLYQLNLKLNGQLNLPGDFQLHGGLNAGIVNNYDKFKYTAPSQLPRVRTYMREYMTESRLTMPRLYLSRTARLATNWSAAAYGGYLEEMFAGVGGEILYRQPGSRWAAGVDINQVQQREFSQHWSLRDYKAPTGHARLYWQTPWQDIHMALSVGQYLAKDRGATLALSRKFANGVTMGAFATKTNVSATQFGEGSFNKGVFWTIPFDAFMTSSSRQVASFNWVPLTRDGGAMLDRPLQLMGQTQLLDPRLHTQQPAPRPNSQRIPDDHSD